MSDYRIFHALEAHLLSAVGPRFRNTGRITPTDFYLIVLWKSNRSKTTMKARLERIANAEFPVAVRQIASSIHAAAVASEKMRILMVDWQFKLPIASAILTILYPIDFTIYDVRVCEQLGDFGELAKQQFSAELWQRYQEYVQAVRVAAPPQLSLRDADRYLWGKSLYHGVRSDLRK